jgi:hypothetical protein
VKIGGFGMRSAAKASTRRGRWPDRLSLENARLGVFCCDATTAIPGVATGRFCTRSLIALPA